MAAYISRKISIGIALTLLLVMIGAFSVLNGLANQSFTTMYDDDGVTITGPNTDCHFGYDEVSEVSMARGYHIDDRICEITYTTLKVMIADGPDFQAMVFVDPEYTMTVKLKTGVTILTNLARDDETSSFYDFICEKIGQEA